VANTNLIASLKTGETRFFVAIAFLLFVLPFGQNGLTNLALILVLINSLVSLSWADWKAAFRHPVFLLSAVFVAYSGLSLFWSEDVANGLKQLETKMSLFAAPLVLAANARFITEASKTKWLKIFVAGCVAVLVTALGLALVKALTLETFEGGKALLFTYVNLATPFMHPGYLSTYVGVAILICIYFLLSKTETLKWLWVFALAFLFTGMFLLQGRINIIALFIVLVTGSLVAAILMRAYKWLLIPLVPVALFIGLLVIGSDAVKTRFLQFPDFKYDISAEASEFNSATYRLAEWTCAFDVISNHPIIGVGLGSNNKKLIEAYEQRKFWVGTELKFNAHNQFLETTLTGGIIGLFFLLILLVGYGLSMVRNKSYLLLATLAFFTLSMITESMFERAWAVILYAVFFPLFLLSSPKGATNKSA
jgi:O-antigen ligase